MFTSIGTERSSRAYALCNRKLRGRIERRWLMQAVLLMLLLAGLSVTAFAQTGSCAKQCTSKTSDCFELQNENPRLYAQCVSQCEKKCEGPPPPPPVTITPKYMIMALVYAPPGCTNGNPAQCGTNNGSSFVDYNQGSSNGTKVSTKDSFQLGVNISYDNSSLIGGIDVGGSYGFSETDSDTTAVNVTKSKTFDLKALGNGDGIDHGQDMFLLLLKPSVTLKKNGDKILWSFTKGGSLFEVLVSELRNPATMRPAVAKVLNEVGLTNDDYQAILSEDPFGGKVQTGNTGHGAVGGITTVNGGVFTTGGGPALDGRRFWNTGWTFPYEPTKASTSCNNGVCNCTAITNAFTNDRATDNITEDTGQTTVDLFASVGVPKEFSLKLDTKMTWTTTGTTDNSTDSKQTASATITCPSVNYTGDQGMAVFWDARYGSFLFIPFDPGATAIMHQGQVMDALGHAVGGRLVQMTYAGKTYHTFTAPDGIYRFPAPNGKAVQAGTAVISTGGKQETVNLSSRPLPMVFHMK